MKISEKHIKYIMYALITVLCIVIVMGFLVSSKNRKTLAFDDGELTVGSILDMNNAADTNFQFAEIGEDLETPTLLFNECETIASPAEEDGDVKIKQETHTCTATDGTKSIVIATYRKFTTTDTLDIETGQVREHVSMSSGINSISVFEDEENISDNYKCVASNYDIACLLKVE